MATSMKTFHLKQHFSGMVKVDDFEMKTHPIPDIGAGECMLEMLYLSVDPYMRPYSAGSMKEGDLMIGGGVGKIIESNDADFPVGCVVVGNLGWRTHALINSSNKSQLTKFPSGVPASYALGVFGLTGMTAYFGFVDICRPQAGETVFVNAAAGAVGNLVGQIGKALGCRVVGCAGSDEKMAYLKEIGFDEVFNYKTVDLEKTLTELCPKGIDVFFDNVGGSFFDTTIRHMNPFGRISLCGAISTYNAASPSTGPHIHMHAIGKGLKIQGFVAPHFKERFPEGFSKLKEWVESNSIDVYEHVVDGFENMPTALIGLFTGTNIGKVVVKM